jgi:asparagine synthase (glutamine-hydrolysing)
MCGIWALIDKDTKDKNTIKNYLNYFWNIQHRGPDNSHLETFSNVYVGFHRLAIMDTSFKSNQPYVIQDKDKTIVFICNGEIYNYKELDKKYNLNVGTSDCLVIPKMFIKTGKLEPEELKGEYAFMMYIFDHMGMLQDYYICRDTIGVRPLYMGTSNNIKMYSSEIKGIPNNFKIKEFPPGHIEHVCCNAFKYTENMIPMRTYIKLYNEKSCIRHTEDIQLNFIRDSVYNSIKRRLDADRPIAFLLSGGVDSSLVASISARILGQPIRTFCCGMEGSTDMIMARKVAEHIGSNHTEITFTKEEALDAINDVINTIESWDTTTIRASVGQYMVSRYIGTKTDCRVVMVGEGPDEVCSSYLFNYYAPSSQALDECSKEYVKNIHMYDGRRADRCTARWGLECRVPFLDPEFIKAYWSIPTDDRIPNNERMEKYMLRKAFDGMDLLPDEILWRKKEAFSDGVSSKEDSWHTIVQKYCEEKLKYTIEHHNYINEDYFEYNLFNVKPKTNEAIWFRYVFEEKYGSLNSDIIPNYWQPKWDKEGNEIKEYIDPSARVLDVYNNGST